MRFQDKKWRDLVRGGFKQTVALQNTTQEEIERRIGEKIGVAHHTIQKWCQKLSNGPPTDSAGKATPYIVEYCVINGRMDRMWAEQLLARAKPNYISQKEIRELLDKLFGELPPKDESWKFIKLEEKLKSVCSLNSCIFAIVAAIYIDQLVKPVDQIVESGDFRELAGFEAGGLHPTQFNLGGSGLWVGRFLHLFFGQESHLYGVRGKGHDLLSSEFNRRLRAELLLKKNESSDDESAIKGAFEKALLEKGINDDSLVTTLVEVIKPYLQTVRNRPRWIIPHIQELGSHDSRTAYTMQLIRSDYGPKIMITYPGILSTWGWGEIKKQLCADLLKGGGGLCYLSGYMRTHLHTELTRHLNELPQNTITCIDHGSIAPNMINSGAVNSLCSAFKLGQIDIYLTTLHELWTLGYAQRIVNLSEIPNLPSLLTSDDVREHIEELIENIHLPAITVVRDKQLPGQTKTFVIINRSVFPIKVKLEQTLGSHNAFNAAFLYFIAKKGGDYENIKKLIQAAVEYAVRYWQKASEPKIIDAFAAY